MVGWSATFSDIHQDAGGHSLLVNRSPLERQIAMYAKKRSMKRIKEIIETEMSSASGLEAEAATTKIAHEANASTRQDPAAYGGVRPTAVHTHINTLTYSVINDEVEDMLNITNHADSVIDVSGIGDGGMLNKRFPLG